MHGRVFDFQLGDYHEHRQVSEYRYEDGCELVPLCKPPTAGAPHVVVIRMHAPVGIRKSFGEAIKSGTPPVMPGPGDTPSGDRLLSFTTGVWAPDTRGPRADQRTFAGYWEGTYAEGCAPVLESTTVAPLERLPGVARGAVVDAAGNRRPYRLQTGRPPFARLPLDGFMAAAIGFLGGLGVIGELLGGWLLAQVTQALDASLDAAGRSDAPPALTGTYRDFAVDHRPGYFSDGIIR